MLFLKSFTPLQKIQLLQRSILVNSFAYYELNENILTDYQYDVDAMQLAELKKEYPDEYSQSRYYEYFVDFCSTDDNQHSTSGFDIIRRVEKNDPQLYRYIWIDAELALKTKRERDESQCL